MASTIWTRVSGAVSNWSNPFAKFRERWADTENERWQDAGNDTWATGVNVSAATDPWTRTL